MVRPLGCHLGLLLVIQSPFRSRVRGEGLLAGLLPGDLPAPEGLCTERGVLGGGCALLSSGRFSGVVDAAALFLWQKGLNKAIVVCACQCFHAGVASLRCPAVCSGRSCVSPSCLRDRALRIHPCSISRPRP